jgi:hypothetical protein
MNHLLLYIKMGGKYRVLGDGAKKSSSRFHTASTLAVGALLIVLLTFLGAGRMFAGVDMIKSNFSYYQTSVPAGETESNVATRTFADTGENLPEKDAEGIAGAKCDNYMINVIKETIFDG